MAAGTPFLAATEPSDAANGIRPRTGGDFVRVTVGALRSGTEEVADALAAAAQRLAARGY